MKILLIGLNKLGSTYGGGQIYMQNLVDAFLADQQDVIYMSLAFANVTDAKKIWTNYKKVKELQLLLPENRRLESNPSSDSNVTAEIAKVFNEIKPAIIHAHGWKEYTCIAAKQCGIPCVVTAHHGGIVCPEGALLNHREEICTVAAEQHTCVPCCVQNIWGGKIWLPFLWLIPLNVQLKLGRWLQKQRFIYFLTPLGTLALTIRDKISEVKTLGKNATRIIAPSHAIRDALLRNAIPEAKISVVPHGIPLIQRQPLRPDFDKTPMRFIFVGRITYTKGLHIMLKAFTRIPGDKYELHIIGGAVTKPERRYLKKIKNKYSNTNTIWHGAVAYEEIPHHIAACDVMLHPTICLEVFGLTIAEALSVGRPVIATRCGGAESQLRDGTNGFLVPPNDPDSLYNVLIKVIEHPELIKKMSEHKSITNTLESHIRDLNEIYKRAG